MTEFRRATEAAKGIYRELHPGGCQMFSLGLACHCFLCRLDELAITGEGLEVVLCELCELPMDKVRYGNGHSFMCQFHRYCRLPRER